MKKTVLAIICLFSLGSGTFQNVSPPSALGFDGEAPNEIYGGVKSDLAELRASIDKLERKPGSVQEVISNIGKATACSIDIPISAVGGTVTLPVTIPASIDRAVQEYYFPRMNDDEDEC